MIPEERGLARATGPATSQLATTRQSPQSEVLRWQILLVLAENPSGLYDDEILEHLDGTFTPSGAQTRRCELVDMGFVAKVGSTHNSRHRKVTVWSLTEAGNAVVASGTPKMITAEFRRYRRTIERINVHPAVLRLRAEREHLLCALTALTHAVERGETELITAAVEQARQALA